VLVGERARAVLDETPVVSREELLAATDRPVARSLTLVCAALAVVVGAYVAVTVKNSSARQFTSGRSRLVSETWPVFAHHPLLGVGVGAQALASHEQSHPRLLTQRNASHTTPLTVAAELGVVGVAAYVLFLAGAARLLLAVVRRNRSLGLGLAAVFLVPLVHSLVYAGFFEDPVTWGSLALAAAYLVAQPAEERVAAPAAATGGSDAARGSRAAAKPAATAPSPRS
jgi:O-antigen ligase